MPNPPHSPVYLPSFCEEFGGGVSVSFEKVAHLRHIRQQEAGGEAAGGEAARTVSAPSAAVFGGFSHPARDHEKVADPCDKIFTKQHAAAVAASAAAAAAAAAAASSIGTTPPMQQ